MMINIKRLTDLCFWKYFGFVPGILIVLFASAASEDKGFVSYINGDRVDVSPATTGGLLLVGGSDDLDDAMQWMVDKSGRGDFVILRASGDEAYDQWLMDKGANSVETLLFTSRVGASDPYVLKQLRNAEAIFFAGGDQSMYVNFWKGTPVADIVNQKARQGIPIGGTSAGLAVLGQFVYSAQFESSASDESMANPFEPNLTLDRDFLSMPYLENVITDSHFAARDRMGRLLAFLGRLSADGWAPIPPRGLGVEERNAVAIESNGTARLYGTGNAYFLTTHGAPALCEPNKPLTYEHISVFRMSAQSTFDFPKWQGEGGETYEVSVRQGKLSSSTGKVY